MKTNNSNRPETVTGANVAGQITDKRGYAERWSFSSRHIDNLIAQGLPHLKIGNRRVRILIDEADAWMKERFGIQRRAPANRATTIATKENAL